MKENMGRFGNVPDALRAYNGGWNTAKWGNPETAAYAAKVLGTDEEEGEAEINASTAEAVESGAATRALSPAASLWDRPASGPKGRKTPPVDLSPVAAAIAAARDAIVPQAPAKPDFGPYQAMVNAQAGATEEKQKLADNTSFFDTMKAGANEGLISQTLKFVFKDEYKADPNFKVPEEELKGKSVSEMTDLRAARSRPEFDRILFDQDYDKEQSDITYRNGTLYGFGASMLADLPGAAATGGITSLAFHGAGMGAVALARQGRRLAALGSLAAEGALGNVAYTAGLDALGKHQGTEAYALAVAGGMLNPLLGGRAIGRTVDRQLEAEAQARIVENARVQQELLLKQATTNLGDKATGEELAAEMSRLEAEGLRAEIASHTATVPESRKFNVGDETPEAKGGEMEPAIAATHMDEPPSGKAPLSDEHMIDNTEYWEDPKYQAKRLEFAKNDQGWRDSIFRRTDGEYTPEKLQELEPGVTHTASMADAAAKNVRFANAAKLVDDIVAEYMPGAKVLLTTGARRGENGAIVSLGDTHVISLNLMTAEKGQTALDHTTLHELGHAIFHHNAPTARPEVLEGINRSWLEFIDAARANDPAAWEKRYAATSEKRYSTKAGKDTSNQYALDRDEYMAEQFVQHIHGRMVRGDFGQLSTGVVERLTNAIKQVLDFVHNVAHKVTGGLDDGPEQFFSEVLKGAEKDGAGREAAVVGGGGNRAPQMVQQNADVASDVNATITDPIARKYGLDMLPMGTLGERAEAKQILNLYRRADAWAAANPIDENRLNKILSRFDSFDPLSNQMLRSRTRLSAWSPSELLENGGGAAGRRSSAAISKYMNEHAIIGNVINDMEGSSACGSRAKGRTASASSCKGASASSSTSWLPRRSSNAGLPARSGLWR
jgi:hypothetical protein